MANSNAVQLAEYVGAALTADGATGIVTAYKFVGDGSSLTGIDATSIKDSGGTVRAQANTSGVDITGIVTATSFDGDGSALTGLPAGLGTALAASGDGANVYYTAQVLDIGSNLSIDVPATSVVAYTQYAEVAVASGVDLTIADGDDFVSDILGIGTTGTPQPLAGSGGRVRADNYTDRSGSNAPTFPNGVNVTGIATATNVSASSSVTAATFYVGTGGADTKITGVANSITVDGGSSAVNLQFKETSGAYQRMGIVKDNDKLQLGEYNNDGTTFTDILTVTGNGDKVGINTTEPFSELHIAASNVAKTWTTYDGTVLTVENYDSDGSIIQMVGRNTAPCGIWFGDEDSKNSGRLRYDHSTDMLSLWASGGQKRLGCGPTLSEKTKVTAGKLSDNTNIDLDYGNVHLFTTAESTTCTPNIRVDSSTTLNSVMEVGETTVVTLITTANASAYCEHITIDGSAVTENWIGGSAPSDGGSSGVDIHSFTIIKTAADTYTVLGNHSKTS